MTRSTLTALVVLLTLALALGCGRYGKPVRTYDPAAANTQTAPDSEDSERDEERDRESVGS